MRIFKIALLLAAIALSTQGHSFDLPHIVAKAAYDYLDQPRKKSGADDVGMPAATGNFDACRHNFVNGVPPAVANLAQRKARALCFNGFAVLHSGASKTPIYSAEVLSRDSILAAKSEQRTNRFFPDARLPSSERATLEDYAGSGFDRGHLSPAGDRDNPESMAQSFSLANMMPQAPENNRKAWSGIEQSTRKYVMRAKGNVYVITGPITYANACPIRSPNCTIGNGVVVPSHIFKLVYDPSTQRAWAHWIENTDSARVSAPINYTELVRRTGIEFLPGIHPKS